MSCDILRADQQPKGFVMRRTFIKSAVALAITAISAGVMAQAPAPPAGGPPAGGPPRGGGGLAPMLVESKAFADGGIIPLKYSMYGGSTQPDFKITSVPATAQSIAIIFHDLDVSIGGATDDNLHWIAWNIPVVNGTATMEEGKLPEGAVGRATRGAAFMGPGAPNSPRYHHYVFEFYALSSKIDLPANGLRPELLEAMKGKVVAKAAYVGRFRNDTNAQMARPPGAPGAGGPGGPAPGAPPRPAGQ
jgi:Raf kinase inhibitor-like YbhB/YbcL family protein